MGWTDWPPIVLGEDIVFPLIGGRSGRLCPGGEAGAQFGLQDLAIGVAGEWICLELDFNRHLERGDLAGDMVAKLVFGGGGAGLELDNGADFLA